MKSYAIGLLAAVGLAAGLGSASVIGQTGEDTVEAHVVAAKAAAGQEHTALFNLCDAPAPAPTPQAGQPPAAQPHRPISTTVTTTPPGSCCGICSGTCRRRRRSPMGACLPSIRTIS